MELFGHLDGLNRTESILESQCEAQEVEDDFDVCLNLVSFQ